MTAVLPRHILCVLGSGMDLDEIARIAAKEGFRLDPPETEFDPRMPAAFTACLAEASFTDADWQAVESHDTVAYLISLPLFPEVARSVAQATLTLTADLFRSGATAIKNESNGLTHGKDRWLEFAEDTGPVPLYYAWVKRPISTGDLYMSCGMHLLGAPDVSVVWPGDPAPDDVAELLDALALYLLTEDRAAEMKDGEGFRLAKDAPRWILTHHPDDQYEPDDFFHNPYGHWRLTPA
ncbi:hypothetical protein [Spirillospora sp. CA-294931]|uniref:hypothetical protein n=1 Tax=Spirillospora sp. CA-294931 TaxID=3240042 RepID=UPI003D933AC5